MCTNHVNIERSKQNEEALNRSAPRPPTKKEQATPQKRGRTRLEKRVSVDLIPITLDEIECAMADVKIQEEDREIQEARERIQQKKEARASTLAALANAPIE